MSVAAFRYSQHRWYWFLASLVIVVAIALTACNPSRFKANANQVTQLVASTPSDPKTFNVALLAEYPNVFGFLYEGLVTENGKGEIQPALAESWQFSEDKQHVVFVLRDGLKWSDGHPLTVDDVVFSFRDVYLNSTIPTGYQDTLKIGKKGRLPTVRKLDDHRVEFTVPEPFAPLLRGLESPIMPAHALRDSVLAKDAKGQPRFFSTWGTDTDPQAVIVNGPYRMTSYAPSQRLVFERNPYYWRRDAQGKQQPYIDRIIWQIVPSRNTALLQFRSGGLDLLSVSVLNYALLKHESERGHFTIQNGGPDSGTTFLTFNLNKGKRNGTPLISPIKSRWFNTKAFRQAVAYAIDRQAMLDNTLQGLGTLQDSPISVQSPYYLSPQEGLKVYAYDPAKAKALLLSAGFQYDARQQLLDAEGNRVRFTLQTFTGNPRFEAMGAQIKRDLSNIGIVVDYNLLDFGTLANKVANTFDWECILGSISGSVEPYSGFNVWATDGSYHPFNQKPQRGQALLDGREVAEWEEKIEQLYIQSAQEFDEAKRKQIFAETQQITQEYLPFIHLVNPLSFGAVRDRVQGVQISSLFYESLLWDVVNLKMQHQ